MQFGIFDANNWLCPSWCCNPSPANVVLPAVAPIKNPLAWESPAAHARSPTLWNPNIE